MDIVAIQESFVDYPEHLSLVFFVKECNWNCTNCQNKYNLKNLDILDKTYITNFIQESSNLFYHYVISGGEPTVYPDLVEFVKFIREINPRAKIKLDTNGSNYKTLKEVLPFVNAVSMDIKTSFLDCDFTEYEKIVGAKVSSIELLSSIGLLYDFSQRGNLVEFRTTLVDDSINIDKVLNSIKEVVGKEIGSIKYTVNKQVILQNTL